MNTFISDPKLVAQKIWSKISPQVKSAFFSAIVIGLLTHAFGIITLMPNHDGIQTTLIHSEDMLYQGRWFQKYVSLMTSAYSMPWVNGCVSILLLSFAAALVVWLFDVKNKMSAVLIAGFLVTFPATTSIFAYLYMADAFAAALFLSVLAVFVSRKMEKWGFLPAAIFICLSLGIYQSYICLSAALYVALLFWDAIEKKRTVKKILFQGLRDVAALALGTALYFAVLNLMLYIKGVELIDYQNINQLNEIGILNIFPRIEQALRGFINYFEMDVFSYYPFPFAVVHLSVLLFLFSYGLYFFIKQKIYKSAASAVLFFVLAALIPIAFYSVALLSAAGIHSLMLHSMCVIYILFIKLGEGFSFEIKNANIKNISAWAVILVSLVMLYSNYLLANRSYLALKAEYNQTYAYATKLSACIENNEDYYNDIPIVFVGYSAAYDAIDTPLKGFEMKDKYLIHKPYRLYTFFRDYIGSEYNIVAGEITSEIVATSEYNDMPKYPLEGSIREINGVLVVRLGDFN